jgi:uncharacterized protein (DUF58 family)
MPTRRAFIFLILALALYFLANQTQVGWVYIMVDLLLGLLVGAFLYGQGLLSSLQVERRFQPLSPRASSLPAYNLADGESELKPPELYEDDPIEIELHFKQNRLRPAFFISGQELCPFAPPDEQLQPFFIPSLFREQGARLTYQTSCDRRGVYPFSPLALSSKGPFSMFSNKRKLGIPGNLLIYPAYHPLKRLRLLEQQGFADRPASRTGPGGEVIGAREYRAGDSMRQIHWRSTARTGKLVVKEFADNDQLTMTVALDLSATGSLGEGTYSTFETAVRIAASLGYYATRRDIPFYLAGQSQRWKPLAVALGWWSILNYLAKVENDGQTALADLLPGLASAPFLVVLVSRPDEATGRALAALQQRGSRTLALFISPDGTVPVSALAAGGERLVVKSASPHSWVEVLNTL